MSDAPDTQPTDPGAGADPDVAAEQHRHLRRILVAFAVVIVLVPIVALGGSVGALLLILLLVVGVLAALAAARLRRSVRRHGDARGR